MLVENSILGVLWWHSRLRIQCGHCCGSGRSCGAGLIPGPKRLHAAGANKNQKLQVSFLLIQWIHTKWNNLGRKKLRLRNRPCISLPCRQLGCRDLDCLCCSGHRIRPGHWLCGQETANALLRCFGKTYVCPRRGDRLSLFFFPDSFLFLYNDFYFFHYSWLTVFCQFSTV